MQSSNFFPQADSVQFKQLLNQYIKSMDYQDLNLTENEIAQLQWHMGYSNISPEARNQTFTSLNFEIMRSLARRNSLGLLFRGDDNAYEQFIKGQNKETCLSRAAFDMLSGKVRSLSPDVQVVIKASCLFAPSQIARDAVKAVAGQDRSDGEEFLTQAAILLRDGKISFPLTKNFTPDQFALFAKIYWEGMHFRHILFTEGFLNMIITFIEGIRSNQFNQQNFDAFIWRWLPNMFGFHIGSDPKYYDQDTHELACYIIQELEKMFTNPDHSFLENYLLKRADLAGFTNPALNLTQSEQKLLGHIAAYFNLVNVVTPELGMSIYAGFAEFKKENPNVQLDKLYADQLPNTSAKTPTYVPAIINTAYHIFNKIQNKSEAESIKLASQFMCQVLQSLYAVQHDQRISCMVIARKENLMPILDTWLRDHHAIKFSLDEKKEFVMEKVVPQLRLT